MVTIDQSNPLKTVREQSYLLYALIKNLPVEDQNKLTLQKVNYQDRKSLLFKLHLLNCACDRAERGVLPSSIDEKTFRVKTCQPRMRRRK